MLAKIQFGFNTKEIVVPKIPPFTAYILDFSSLDSRFIHI
jgi:hypothetical protein